MDFNKLKGILREKDRTYAECALALGISITSFSSKINGRTKFDIVEINKLVSFLNLTKDEAVNIFLIKNLHVM